MIRITLQDIQNVASSIVIDSVMYLGRIVNNETFILEDPVKFAFLSKNRSSRYYLIQEKHILKILNDKK